MKKIITTVFGYGRPLHDGNGLNIRGADVSLRRKQLSLIECGGVLL